jgi:hypothetical protein
MRVSDGYNTDPTEIRIETSNHQRTAELWIEQWGLPRYMVREVDGEEVWERTDGHSETLACITLDELMDLRDEINAAIQEIVA